MTSQYSLAFERSLHVDASLRYDVTVVQRRGALVDVQAGAVDPAVTWCAVAVERANHVHAHLYANEVGQLRLKVYISKTKNNVNKVAKCRLQYRPV